MTQTTSDRKQLLVKLRSANTGLLPDLQAIIVEYLLARKPDSQIKFIPWPLEFGHPRICAHTHRILFWTGSRRKCLSLSFDDTLFVFEDALHQNTFIISSVSPYNDPKKHEIPNDLKDGGDCCPGILDVSAGNPSVILGRLNESKYQQLDLATQTVTDSLVS
jgi:hypothetical protein